MENSVYKLQKVLKKSNIELIFSGTFSQGLIEELGEALKERLRNQQVTKSKISSAFFTFVEQAQNIRNYLVSKENTSVYDMIAGSGVVAISKTELGYSVNSGNVILNEDVKKLEEKLEMVLSMRSEELNNYYKQIIRNEINTDSGRAGLGIIQIARKAAGPIEYQFENIDDTYSFYTLTVVV